MANITIVKTGNSIILTFNAYATAFEIKKSSYDSRDIVEVVLHDSEAYVVVMMRDAHGQRKWDTTFDSAYIGTDYVIIDSIDGVAPSSNQDLFNKINALR